MRKEDPSGYVRTVASLMARELNANIDAKFTDFKDWMQWMQQSPELVRSTTDTPERIEEKPHNPIAALKKPEPPCHGPIHLAFNASAAAAREPIVEKPRLQIEPHEAEKF